MSRIGHSAPEPPQSDRPTGYEYPLPRNDGGQSAPTSQSPTPVRPDVLERVRTSVNESVREARSVAVR
jgi:hypothetical protein